MQMLQDILIDGQQKTHKNRLKEDYSDIHALKQETTMAKQSKQKILQRTLAASQRAEARSDLGTLVPVLQSMNYPCLRAFYKRNEF